MGASSQATVEDQFRSSFGLRDSFKRAVGDGGPQAAQDFELPSPAPEGKFRSSRGLQSSGASFRQSIHKGVPQQTTLPEIPEKTQLQQDSLRKVETYELMSGLGKAKGRAGTARLAHASDNTFRAEPSQHDLKKYNAIFDRGLAMEQQKETRMQAIRRQLLEKEMSECTFQPRFASGTVGNQSRLGSGSLGGTVIAGGTVQRQRLVASQSEPLIPKMRKTFSGAFTDIHGLDVNGIARRAGNVDPTGLLRKHVTNMGAPSQKSSAYMSLNEGVAQAKDPWP